MVLENVTISKTVKECRNLKKMVKSRAVNREARAGYSGNWGIASKGGDGDDQI